MIYVLVIFLVVAGLVFATIQLIPRERIESRDTLFSRTFGKLMDNERTSALEDLRLLYQQSGQDPSVGMALGILLRDLGKVPVAIRTHRSLTARPDLEPDFLAMIRVELALDYLVDGQLARARETIEDALGELADQDRAVMAAERVFVQSGAFGDAVRVVQTYGKKRQEDVSRRVALIRVAEAASATDPRETMAAYKKALAADAACIPALLGMCAHWQATGLHEKVPPFLEKHADAFLGHAWQRFQVLMACARDLSDNEIFLRPGHHHLDHHTDDWRARRLLAHFQMVTGEHEDAGENLLACLEQEPKRLVLHRTMWSLLSRMPQPAALMRRYQQRFETDAVFEEIWACPHCGRRDSQQRFHCSACHHGESFVEREI